MLGPDEAQAYFEPAAIGEPLDSYLLHLALLDGALQAFLALLAGKSAELRDTLYPRPGTPPVKGAKGKAKKVPELSYSYVYKFHPLMEQRLSQGGVRLAAYLNFIFAQPLPAK